MPLHDSPHPLRGRHVRIESGRYEGALGELVDWYDRESGRSWTDHPLGDPALAYAFRSAYERMPLDDEVVVVRMHTGAALFHVEQVTTRVTGIPALEHVDAAAIEVRP